MNRQIGAAFAAVVTSVVFVLLAVSPASATTFCVPVFHPACPNVPGNQAQADLQTAMAVLGNDGIPDRIIISDALPPHAGSIFPLPFFYADDPLEVVGAGVDKTIIRATGSNIIAMNLDDVNFRQRKVTFRDLSFVAPSGQSQLLVQSTDDVFDGVNFISQDATNVGGGSEAIYVINGSVLNHVAFSGVSGGSFGRAISTGAADTGDTLDVTGSVIRDSGTAIVSTLSALLPVTIKDSHIAATGQVLFVNDGEQSLIQNSIIEAGEFTPLYVVGSNGPDSALTLRNSTIINKGGGTTAIKIEVPPSITGLASVVASDSIIRDFQFPWQLTAPVSGLYGNANLNISYSNVSSTGSKTGDGTLTATEGMIDKPPAFAGVSDYHLSAGSPSIDAGNPAAGGLLTDIEGSVRPLDGNGDGLKVRDQGAYEAPAVAPTCETDPTVCPIPDTTGPAITKVKFKHGKSPKKGGTLKFIVSEASTTKVTFKPLPAKKKGQKKRKTRKFSKRTTAAASVTIKIKKGKLRPGKYRLTIKSTDDSGNPGKPVVRKVKVKG